MVWKALTRLQRTNKGILLQESPPCWSASLCQADSTPKSLTWTDNRKNSEVQRRCDLLKVTKVFTGRVQTWPGGHKRHLCPRCMESTVCLNGILVSLVISQGQLCTPGSEGLPWTLSGLHGSRTQGRTELGLWVLFCLAVTAFTLICCQRKYIMWREQYHKQHTPIPQFQLLTYLLHFYPTLLPFPPLDYFAANLDISAHCKHSLCVSITKKLFYNPFEKDFCPRK